MATETERIARIEGAYEHRATKADVRGVKAETQSVRSDLTAEIQSVRSDLTAEIQSVRSELKAEIRSLRTELKAEIQDVRSELKADIQDVRSGMDVMRNELRWLRWLMAIGVAGILLPLLQRLFAFLS